MAVAVAVVAVVVAVVVVFVVDARRSGRLERSETCGDVEPGGTRFRAGPSAGTATPDADPDDPSAGAAGAGPEPAFRPATAEPVFCQDFADPFVLVADTALGSRVFAYATNTAVDVVPVLSSGSLLRGEQVDDALPELPAWSEPGAVWAPAVLARDDGTLVLYYTTTHRESGRQCISVATADDPLGPFRDRSDAPLVCPVDLGGAIDASPVVGPDGDAYLLWKNDGNCCDVPTRIWSQRLADDRTSLVGEAHELIGADQDWEGGLVEAPSMVEHDGVFHLFYSANDWESPRYAVGHARCDAPVGPCTKTSDQPWLAGTDDARGPGGQEVFRDGDGQLQMVFHAWPGEVGYAAGGYRSLFTVPIDLTDADTPVPAP